MGDPGSASLHIGWGLGPSPAEGAVAAPQAVSPPLRVKGSPLLVREAKGRTGFGKGWRGKARSPFPAGALCPAGPWDTLVSEVEWCQQGPGHVCLQPEPELMAVASVVLRTVYRQDRWARQSQPWEGPVPGRWAHTAQPQGRSWQSVPDSLSAGAGEVCTC